MQYNSRDFFSKLLAMAKHFIEHQATLKYAKLLAAKSPNDGMRRHQIACEDQTDTAKRLVTRSVTIAVIDRLEMIEIQIKQRSRQALMTCGLKIIHERGSC
ncbi:hypothetical protein SAMN03159406_04257 [Rhizobium sp. NFR03]|nr:hypothetical protein SAMN03159406_04257 [Rhizobium sp. NFR03]